MSAHDRLSYHSFALSWYLKLLIKILLRRSIWLWACGGLVGPAEVNKVKIFSGPCYMIKRVLTFVSGLQGSVLVDFRSQNKVKSLHKVKTCQNSLHQKFPYKNEQIYIFLYFFEFLSCYYNFMCSFI